MPVVTPVTLDSPRVKQLSDGNPNGTALGTGPTDLVGFYTSTVGAPVSQASGPAQAAVTRGQQSGSISTFATSQSPQATGGVGPNTSAEASITGVIASTAAWIPATTDLVLVNKPTSQAGLGVGNARVSTANQVGLTLTNYTAATITPTAGQKYGIVALRGLPFVTATITPTAIVATSTSEQSFTVAGIRKGEVIHVLKPSLQAGLDIINSRVIGDNTVGITYANVTSGTTITPSAEQYTFFTLGGLDALNNEVLIQSLIGTIVGGAGGVTITTTSVTATVTGLATTDMIKGISKPTNQAGLGIVGAQVNAASTLGVQLATYSSTTVTPTASEVWGISIHRPNPAAPCVVYSATLTPTAVASQTTAEQSFTITGLVASSMAWVNKPSFTSGLGIAGVRVSGANALAINFCNVTSNAITPPSETYLVANYQQAIPDAGDSFVFSAVPASQQANTLLNAIRTATVNLGLIAGA